MRPFACALLLLTTFTTLAAEQTETPAETQANFTYKRALITGTVEGVTEFLPVSSTGHMIISDRLMNVPHDKNIMVRDVSDHKGRPISQDRVADDYIVIIQVGAIAAVLVVFFGRAYLFSIEVVAGALMIGGIVILGAEQLLPKVNFSENEVAEINPRQAMTIGLCQCFALIPGTSRSLSTILGGRLAGLSNAAATEFSFLVGLITLTAASFYKMWSLGPALGKVYPAGPASLGLIVAAVTAFIAVKWMVSFVSRRGMGPFAWYRIVLGGAILLALALGYKL
ncbi:MAG: undecaprenyl-diphosphate phosphatase [Verrucomicrobia bacterium]|nr:undecaprenyl-diphosphate phosphatase [Verrucomicrobiota bacterium]